MNGLNLATIAINGVGAGNSAIEIITVSNFFAKVQLINSGGPLSSLQKSIFSYICIK